MQQIEKGVYSYVPIVGETPVRLYRLSEMTSEQVERYGLQKYYEFWRDKEKI